MPDTEKVWTYFNFDNTVEPILPAEGFRNIAISGTSQFTDGLCGSALTISDKGPFVLINHGRKDFPVEKGSMLLLFKPHKPLGKEARWLVEGAWASFSLQISGDRILAYATGNPQQFLAGSLKEWKENWEGRWHFVVFTWEEDKRNLFFDGSLIAEKTGVSRFNVPYILCLGYLPQNNMKSYGAILEGSIDEFALLSVPLNSTQVSELFNQIMSGKYQGILNAFGGSVIVQTVRHGYIRGEVVEGKVSVYGSGDSLRLTAISEITGQVIPLGVLSGKTSLFTIDTKDLRPGRYLIYAELIKNNKVILKSKPCLLGINAQRRPEFPVGVDGILCEDENLLRNASNWHLDHTAAGGDSSSDLFWRLDKLFTYGISLVPNLNIHYHRALPLPEEFFDAKGEINGEELREKVLQILVLHGDTSFTPFSSSLASPFSEIVQELMRKRIKDYLEKSKNHPGLVAISFDDEYVFRMGRDSNSGKIYYGDYSASARKYFTKLTGFQPVFPPVEPKGTIFDDTHPYFKWKDIIGMPHDASCAGLAKTHKELTEFVHSIRPDVLTTTWSGGEYGIVDVIMDYAYPSIWQPNFGYNIGHGRIDWHKDMNRARQKVEQKKPLWGLVGWWSSDLSNQPSHCVEDFRLNTILYLTKGVESITWFTLYQGGIISRDDLKNEMIKWADWIYRFGPMFKKFHALPSTKVAVLLSEENIVGHIAHTGSGIHSFCANWFYPALRIANVPVDVVTDDQVKAGILDEYNALILYNFNYASRSLWNAIDKFSKTPGKIVFADNQSNLLPQNTIKIPFNALGDAPAQAIEKYKNIPYYGTRNMAWMAGQLREIVASKLPPPEIRVNGSDFVAPFVLYSRGKGQAKMLILINYDTTSSQSVQVVLQTEPDTVVYEFDTGKEIGFATATQPVIIWNATIKPADWKIYLLCSGRIEKVDVKADYSDGECHFQIKILDDNNLPLKAGLPVKLELIDPNGNTVSEYMKYSAINPDDGVLKINIPRAKLMDFSGTWTARVEELITGKKCSVKFNVR